MGFNLGDLVRAAIRGRTRRRQSERQTALHRDDGVELPTADEVVRQFAHATEVLFAAPDGELIDTAEDEAVADIRIGQAAIQPETLEKLLVGAKGATAIVNGFREGVGTGELQTVVEAAGR